jgi:DnaK suppressor protein
MEHGMTAPQCVLTTEQIDQIRGELERTLTRLERSTKSSNNGHSAEIDQGTVGRLSRIEAIQNQGLIRTLHEREQQQLEQVAEALQRIAAGSYGICTACRTPIRFERLLIFPEARTCSHCVELN